MHWTDVSRLIEGGGVDRLRSTIRLINSFCPVAALPLPYLPFTFVPSFESLKPRSCRS
jgi:hypothetical protein